MTGTGRSRRKIEIFSAGCPVCEEAVAKVTALACSSCDVHVLDMNDPAVAKHAKALGVRSVPSVAVDGSLLSCCAGHSVDEKALKEAGVGTPLT
jgi:glutaredoxin 3